MDVEWGVDRRQSRVASNADTERESWLPRSTCDANSIASLNADLDDDEDFKTPVEQLQEPTKASTFGSAKCRLDYITKERRDCLGSNEDAKRKLAIASDEKLWKLKWVETDTTWSDCLTPVAPAPFVLLEPAAVYVVVATNIALVVVATFLFSAHVRVAIAFESLPHCSLLLLIFIALGLATFLGGLLGDSARHRGLVVRRASVAWSVAVFFLLAGYWLDISAAYAVGLGAAYIAAGALVPNIVIAGTTLEYTGAISGDAERRQMTSYYGWGTVVHVATVASAQILCVLTSVSTQAATVTILCIVLLVTVAWLHVHTRHRRWPPQVARVPGVGVGWSTIKSHWLLALAAVGAIGMLVGTAAVLTSLFLPPVPSGYGPRFVTAASGTLCIVLSWALTFVSSVSSFNAGHSVHRHRRQTSDSEPFAIEDLAVLRGLSLLPIGCVTVFMASVRGQLYGVFLLHLCQTNIAAFGSGKWFSPEFAAVAVYGFGTASFPLLQRLLSVEFAAFGRSTRLLHALVLYLVAAFIAGILELYRRSSQPGATGTAFDGTCHKATTTMDMGWSLLYLAPLSIGEMLARTCVGEIGAFILPRRHMGLAAAVFALCDVVGLAATLGVTVMLTHWFGTPGATDLELVLLFSTTLACIAYAAMKRLIEHYQACQIWL
ncbi:hypothetical protein ACHHYP_16696 [Achlya hypogyna]|uniref:Uncharacterized protein n=1 Tax=Achlya hypogyna TaxID=1202772 RepID=A0A1V9Y641_ACHHY|nr:hypothetical protein ACHHYP_16696 [Achlya hypogyna]